jgi:Uncharacterized conserved protein
MVIHQLKTVQLIQADLETVWDFISSPRNLKHITPDYMGFEIITPDLSEKMYAGQIIQYIVKPLFNIPLHWCTEITHVQPLEYFVDEQRQGPYALWHHQHHLVPTVQGIEMTDIVHYAVPLGRLGDVLTASLVRKKLEEIFNFRYKALETYFSQKKYSTPEAAL